MLFLSRLLFAALLTTSLSAIPAVSNAGIEHSFLYHPRQYKSGYERKLPKQLVTLEFETTSGQQFAYYMPPANRTLRVPARLWVCFGGNASLALDWAEMADEGARDRNSGYLMVEYPGYGKCAGVPSAASILENSEGAFKAVAGHLKVEPDELGKRLSLIGYSLGTATALQFAVHYPVEQIILISPFTSIRAMAAKYAGLFGSLVVSQQFDSMGRLSKLAARERPPKVVVIHGDRDAVCPVEMGREIARKYPEMVEYHEVEGGDHLSIFARAAGLLFEAMQPERTHRRRR